MRWKGVMAAITTLLHLEAICVRATGWVAGLANALGGEETRNFYLTDHVNKVYKARHW
jgi:hypothetical protein